MCVRERVYSALEIECNEKSEYNWMNDGACFLGGELCPGTFHLDVVLFLAYLSRPGIALRPISPSLLLFIK